VFFDILETYLFRRGTKAQEESNLRAFCDAAMKQLESSEGIEAVAFGRAWAVEHQDPIGGIAAAEAFGRVMKEQTEAYVSRRSEELRQFFGQILK
jgi:hypothetical protein